MPYAKRSSNGRTYYTAKRARYTAPARQQVARLNYKALERRMQRTLGLETKHMDSLLSTGSLSDTAVTNLDALCVNLLENGSASFQRVGDKITLKKLELFMMVDHICISQTVGLQEQVDQNMFRILVVHDTRPDSALPALSDIIGSETNQGVHSAFPFDHQKLDTRTRFTILGDKVTPLLPPVFAPADNVNSRAVRTTAFKMSINLRDRVTEYTTSSTPPVLNDMVSGAIYIYFRAMHNLPTRTHVQVNASSRARLTYMG